MKKLQIILMSIILLFLVSCDFFTRTSSTDANDISTNDITGDISTEPLENPFSGLNFIRPISLTDSVLNKIQDSSGRIAYLDEEIYVYYEDALFDLSSFYIDVDGETKEFDTHQPMGYSYFHILNYDVDNEVLYYYRDGRIYNLPSDIEDDTNLYASSLRSVQYINSRYTLISGEFKTFRGETLFSGSGIKIYPYTGYFDDHGFHAYSSDLVQDHGCTINSYDGFTDEPTNTTVVHDDYTCSASYSINNKYALIELIDFIRLGGYVTISPDGDVNVMDFEQMLPDFDSYVTDSLSIKNKCLVYFQYEDTSGTIHKVYTDFSLSYFKIDDPKTSSDFYFANDEYLLYRQISTEYQLYKNEELLYTYTTRNATSANVYMHISGNYGLIYETNISSNGRITRVNLNDGTSISYDISPFSAREVIGDFIIYVEDSDMYLYNYVTDEKTPIGPSGKISLVNDDYFIISIEDKIYLYDLLNLEKTEMDQIGYFNYYNYIYAYLVEFDGQYYIIG